MEHTESRSPPSPTRAPIAVGREARDPGFSEHRRWPRKTLVLVLARLTAGANSAVCRVRNLSATGLGIETSIKLKRGDRLTVAFPDQRFDALICWSQGIFAGLETYEEFCPEELVSRYSTSPDRPKWEHEYLTLLCAELVGSVARLRPIPGMDHHRIRQRFSQALRAHLKYEDWAIYPALLRHADPSISAAAASLKTEMGGLEQSLSDYTRYWITNPVEENWAEYCRDTNALADALMRRLRQEDRQLYAHLP